MQLGVEVTGIQLNENQSEDIIEQIKSDVTQHCVMIFRNQGNICGERHVEISRCFGELKSPFYQHPKSPHHDVFRVSNDPNEGTNVGRTGWHIDGTFIPAPYGYSLYHIVSVSKGGDTVFLPLTELVESLEKEKRLRWERLWTISDRKSTVPKPLIYCHPKTGLPTMCVHLGFTEAFTWDFGTEKQRTTKPQETKEILQEMHEEFVKDNCAMHYSHKWEPGDFIITDNLAVAHEAAPDTQLPREDVGLRILHRTTTTGTHTPQKKYRAEDLQF